MRGSGRRGPLAPGGLCHDGRWGVADRVLTDRRGIAGGGWLAAAMTASGVRRRRRGGDLHSVIFRRTGARRRSRHRRPGRETRARGPRSGSPGSRVGEASTRSMSPEVGIGALRIWQATRAPAAPRNLAPVARHTAGIVLVGDDRRPRLDGEFGRSWGQRRRCREVRGELTPSPNRSTDSMLPSRPRRSACRAWAADRRGPGVLQSGRCLVG